MFDGFEDGLFAHLLNTVAGSILVTLMIADMAEMAHMPTRQCEQPERASPAS